MLDETEILETPEAQEPLEALEELAPRENQAELV